MDTFYSRLTADWFTLAGLLLDHPLLWVPTFLCIWAFLDRLTPLIMWLCAGVLYAVGAVFALIVGWLERDHAR